MPITYPDRTYGGSTKRAADRLTYTWVIMMGRTPIRQTRTKPQWYVMEAIPINSKDAFVYRLSTRRFPFLWARGPCLSLLARVLWEMGGGVAGRGEKDVVRRLAYPSSHLLPRERGLAIVDMFDWVTAGEQVTYLSFGIIYFETISKTSSTNISNTDTIISIRLLRSHAIHVTTN